MSQKTKRRKSPPEGAIAPIYRAYGLTPRSIDEGTRTVRALITTESPVLEWDWKRYELVPRVLLTSGAQIPPSGQIPFLDSHNRFTTENQLGSARALDKGRDGVEGDLHFSTAADRQWTLVREGHATDVSAGFQVLAETYVDAGQTMRIQGKDFTGPVNVSTKWRLYEVSLTPIGADDQAKLRGFDPNNIPQQEEEDEMTKEQRDLLLSRGMPADLEGDKAIQWAIDNPLKPQGESGQRSHPDAPPPVDVIEELDRRAKEREKQRLEQRQAFITDVDELCSLADLPPEFARTLYECPDKNIVRSRIKDEKVSRSKNPGLGFSSPRVTGEGRDEFRKDLATCLTDRMFSTNSVSEATREKILPASERGKGGDRFSKATISEIGRECLIADGYAYEDVRWLSRSEIATAVFAGPESVGLQKRDGMPYHTTGSFAYLTENAMNKGMRTGYAEARSTWRQVASIGTPMADFKPKRVYITSAVGNLTAWHDGKEPDKTSFGDQRDSYGVEAYAKSLEFSWQLMVNDDMGALIKSPVKLGNAAERTVNTYFWSIVTSNPTLADGQALFLASATGNRFKANYISSGLAVTVQSLSALENLMRQQVGMNTRENTQAPDILNIEPKYLVTPSAIKNTAAAVVKSIADPANTNSNVHNPFTNALELITEPLLDANSTTAWYLAADPNLADGIEISFMQGHETPVMWSGMEEKTLTRWWAIRQVFGGKAIDHRGWAKQAGA